MTMFPSQMDELPGGSLGWSADGDHTARLRCPPAADAGASPHRVQHRVGSWIHIDGAPVPLTAVGTLYGPFDCG